MNANTCHCGNSASFQKCCAPYLAGESVAATAEALMRSRYSAFVEGDVNYILDTHDPSTRAQISENEVREWSRGSEWLGLDILRVADGGEGQNSGVVEFMARYKQNGVLVEHKERSEFRRRADGRWYFVEGRILGQETVLRVEPKVGRNDPCPCGSGQKFKKCCGN